MRSLLLEAVGCLRPVDVPPPSPEPDEVLLRVSHCAVCRTDAKMWRQGHRDLVLPRIPGHEICGSTEASGDRFVVWPGRACGECAYCRTGMENLCPQMSILGFHKDGGFAELVAAPASSLIPAPTDLPGDLACLAEPLGCALNALEQSGVSRDASLLIYGGGTLGLLMALAARETGAHPIVVETDRRKLERSEEFRAHFGITGDLVCSRNEFDIVINATPAFATFPEGLSKLRAGGCFCLFSGFANEAPVPVSLINEIHYRQLHTVGAYGCTRAQMAKALEMLRCCQDRIKLLIEDRIGLEQAPAVLTAVLSGRVFKYIVKF